MTRLLPLLALVISLPAFADLQKCVDAQGKVSYSDRDCPNAARPAAAAPATTARAAGAAPVDDPLEILETGVPVIVQMPGRFAWLDDDTLAITTFADPAAKAPWMVRKIVAYDVPTRKASVLVPRGFVDCVNAAHELVSLDVGDLESRFAIGSRAAPSVQQFDVWDPAARKLGPAPADVKAGWHPSACMKPAPEDLGIHDLDGSKKPVRYLQPEHGTVVWGALDENGHPSGPMLLTPKKKVPLALSVNDISHEVRWLPFRKAYQLAPGVHDRLLDPPRNQPLITMDLDGRIARHAIPAGLTHQLDALNAPAPAEMTATQAGDLVVQPGMPGNGGGLYLVKGEQSRRVWCTAKPAPGQAGGTGGCAMSQPVAVSPDGCRIAFDARPAGAVANGFPDAPTVKVLTLCDGTAPTAAGKKKR
ncbi:DUF4124 domain-containing protein [Scleromatobacter humisilvae]|uniref:DUF4124 domain-containing protein n=1 Tax=Scleromatobacter humisilvae TaxID=2897159 RepID=A0A9X2BXR1_9BURK|nr:DUF4124 domain-containing protein [Scleromatobacter humisilvae]MCK9684843.1 DUF4124 domain-containing protein [Scleromatobacter humisilvae]